MREGGPCPCPCAPGQMGPMWDPTLEPALLRTCLCGVDLSPPEVPGEGDKLLFPQPRVLIVVRPAAQSSLMNCNWKEVPL